MADMPISSIARQPLQVREVGLVGIDEDGEAGGALRNVL